MGIRGQTFKDISWLLYIVPALLVYLFFMAIPLFSSVAMSFFSSEVNKAPKFVGLYNYSQIFTDPVIAKRYWGAFSNTWIFFAVHMLVQNILGITFANLLILPKMKGSAFYRTMIFLPATLSIIVSGYIWRLILNPQWGAVNLLLKQVGLGKLALAWLGEPSIALVIISLVSSWQWVGMPTIMFLAGLNNIPSELYEAVEIDGASRWDTFWAIKLPLLRPVIVIVAILTFVNNFNAFDIVFSMANMNGSPKFSTDILGTFFYRIGIAGQHPVGIPNRGVGAAVASLTFLLLVTGVSLVMLLNKKMEKR